MPWLHGYHASLFLVSIHLVNISFTGFMSCFTLHVLSISSEILPNQNLSSELFVCLPFATYSMDVTFQNVAFYLSAHINIVLSC